MSLDEESLEIVANGGLMDFDKWAGMVEPVLERLEYIVYNAFPMPKASPPEEAQSSLLPTQAPSFPSAQPQDPNNPVPSSSNKENTSPADLQTPPRPTASSVTATSPSSERVPDSQPQSFAGPANEALPAPLQLLLDSVKSTIRSFFTSKPPHTIQRFAELVLRPNAHYRTLPAYLRALDRVISVTSSADVFPLQMQATSSQTNGILNGGSSSFILQDHAPGSDESLGGALLTPIPWLNSASLDMDSSATLGEGQDSVPVPQDQGHELQQSHEADTTSIVTQQPSTHAHSTPVVENEALGANATSPPADTEEVPHARGPPVVGVEDMGLQDGKGVEMALSNDEDAKSDNSAPAEDGQGSNQPTQGDGGNQDTKSTADGDGDIVLSDENATLTATDKPEGPETGETTTDEKGA